VREVIAGNDPIDAKVGYKEPESFPQNEVIFLVHLNLEKTAVPRKTSVNLFQLGNK
jgi:hypothetical protein